MMLDSTWSWTDLLTAAGLTDDRGECLWEQKADTHCSLHQADVYYQVLHKEVILLRGPSNRVYVTTMGDGTSQENSREKTGTV